MFNLQEDEQEAKTLKEVIFRNDDVNPNTDFIELAKIYQTIREYFPGARILQAVTIFGNYKGIKGQGEVYQDDVPFKDNPNNWFYYVNAQLDQKFPRFKDIEIASHGLLHSDHTKLSHDAQEMSIVTSCNILNSKIFVPPFNKWNEDTDDICLRNEIILVKSKNWKNLEYEEFNKNHRLWYFHSWRWTHKSFRRKVWRIPSVKENQKA